MLRICQIRSIMSISYSTQFSSGYQSVELRRLGTSGLRVSALSLGAMTFGASQTLMKGVTSSDEEARRGFERALEAGINLVDTANVYNEGRSEELTGEWVAGKRDQLLIATKCRFPNRLRDDPQTWAARMGPLAQG